MSCEMCVLNALKTVDEDDNGKDDDDDEEVDKR